VSDPTWYKDAIIYELNVRGFCDGNNDGIGDFIGLTSKLDYLCELGVDTLWLLPFYPSPGRDDGYDISDYRRIKEEYGTMRDFEQFLSEAHARGLRVVTELVINHTSDQHEWFQRARNAPEGSPERDWYMWSDTADKYEGTRIIFQDYEDSNWAFDPVAEKYYWHRFYSHQPDLNYDNPEVRQAVIDVLDFWMEKGVDGFRLDAVPYLYAREGTNCESLPETHAFLKELRRHVDDRFPGRMLLAEANQWPEEAADYFGDGDECHMNFHFPLMPRMYMALAREDRQPVVDILDRTPEIPDECQWATFLRNHDELTLEMVTDEERAFVYSTFAPNERDRLNLGIRRRLAPLVQNDRRRLELMNGLLMSMPGTPVIYYGDEIGMGDNVYLDDRYGVRTPMQWSGDRNAGFSKASPHRLYLPVVTEPEYHYAAINVEAQERNPTSLLSWFKRAIALRKQHRAFGRGNFTWVPTDNRSIMAFVRGFYDNKVLVVGNLAGSAQYCELDLSEWKGSTPVELFGQSVFPVVDEDPYSFTLAPYAIHWFAL
jgi:maltose alpha-D-glucosyltransferase/alpha-amylase